ncbi:hypothetical protein GE21DRAFT_5266 [Neurospora crassa]|uniref:Uncharacterized protein n=2 Tax=Neurospora crassa TaxID=5141 RepID=Q7SAZ6_NEUCR|nr:hypothetical protein NCU07629 [Neurospora crassa OR74A]EAA33568.1 hypothetical protein NCU07629 [Neurospora crassa OR74A]KHE84227.1 hypothetical protein GE21DRAFT_5266 [Neurospora crassa]CAE85490.1 hypothetical protein [Neurospora crassa]|eukprot:XP_962804.1 hypothetical protein NCU07629 [Neurospora crassa OR74A]
MPSSNMVTVVQPAPSTASTVSTTTIFVYSQEPPSTASTSTAPEPLIPEPYNSVFTFIGVIAAIVYFIGYTIPHCKKKFIKWLRRKKIREQRLTKEREEKEEKPIREGVEKVVTGVQVLPEAMMNSMAEFIKGAVKEGYENGAKDAMKGVGEIITKAVMEGTKHGYKEGFKDAIEGIEEVIAKAVTKGTSKGIKGAIKEVNQTASDGVEKVVTAVQGIEEMMKVGLEEMDLRARSIEYRVDWMLDYHLDENERFGLLKAILLGLLRKDDPPSDPQAFWGADPVHVENQITVNESDSKNDRKPW